MKIIEDKDQIKFDMGIDGCLLMKYNQKAGDLFVVIDFPGGSRSTIILPFDNVSGRMRYWLDHI